ncbi:hypothetical protein, partial [Escherichia coli]|uniref:hypothetical protein n=1 Tax=Escherichia coli TaxID=562 RepID=UPI0013D5A12A
MVVPIRLAGIGLAQGYLAIPIPDCDQLAKWVLHLADFFAVAVCAGWREGGGEHGDEPPDLHCP